MVACNQLCWIPKAHIIVLASLLGTYLYVFSFVLPNSSPIIPVIQDKLGMFMDDPYLDGSAIDHSALLASGKKMFKCAGCEDAKPINVITISSVVRNKLSRMGGTGHW